MDAFQCCPDSSLQFECKSNGSDDLSPFTINLIGESRMVHVQLWFVLGHQVVAVVQFRSVLREPRRLDAYVVLGHHVHSAERVGLTQRTDQQQQIAARHINLDEDVVLDAFFAGLTRFQVDDDTVVRLNGLEDATQRAHAVTKTNDQSGSLECSLRFGRLGSGVSQDDFLFGESFI